ncbi:MAG: nucleotidyltransferase domain-containing protein [Proteobacteria bacterium]|nr:nucleotidyltransferase domain-containing protein [Pseudomonadota bacterium]
MEIPDVAIIRDILSEDERVVFVYLYGSFAKDKDYKDLDIAVYAIEGCDVFRLSADLKIELHKGTGFAPDFFDVRVINGLLDHGDLFSLLYLKQVLESDELLVDKVFDVRAGFIEKYNLKYRECEGIIDEVLL